MKKINCIKIVALSLALSFIYFTSNSYSNFKLGNQTQTVKSLKTSKVFATITENEIIINYDLVTTGNAYIIITDMSGNQLKTEKLDSTNGKVKLNKSDLEKIGGNGIYTCVIKVNGSQLLSQQLTLLDT